MKTLIILSLLIMAGCMKPSKETVQIESFKVEFLFEHEGCKMYRFFDGRTVYWSNCSGLVSLDHQNGGKTRYPVYEETIITTGDTTK
jgi:hypothetical protein